MPPPAPRRSFSERLSSVRRFWLSGIWSQRLETLPKWKAALMRALRVSAVAVSKFFSDQCMLRASALTFYTLMSIVPAFAVIFGVAKGFGLDAVLERELLEYMAGQEQALEQILGFARNMLKNTRGGLIAGVGVVVMLWSAIKMLGELESALNAMWDIRRHRSWGRRFSDYLAVILLAPVLVLLASSASVFLRTQFDAVVARIEIVGTLGPLFSQALKLTPLVLVWALFVLVYMVMPNKRVRFGSAAVGAAVGGFLYQMVQWLYIDLQVSVSRQNAIYGSFTALPLFLAWVQASWIIVLFGAEVCYAREHAGGYCRASGCPRLAPAGKKLLGLRIAREVIRNFAAGGTPMPASRLSDLTQIPARLVEESLENLVASGILSQTRDRRTRQVTFQPAMDIHLLTAHRVAEALDATGGEDDALRQWISEGEDLEKCLRDMSRAAAESPANRLLMDL